MSDSDKVKKSKDQWISRVMPTGEIMQARKRWKPSRKILNQQFDDQLRRLKLIIERLDNELAELDSAKKGMGGRWQARWVVIADDGLGEERFVSQYRSREVAASLVADCISLTKKSPDWLANKDTQYTIRLVWVPRDDGVRGLPTQDELAELIEEVQKG